MLQLIASRVGDVKGTSCFAPILLHRSASQHFERFRERRTIDSGLKRLLLARQPKFRFTQRFFSAFPAGNIRESSNEAARLRPLRTASWLARTANGYPWPT